MTIAEITAAGIRIKRLTPGGMWGLFIPGLSVRTSRRQADLIAYLAYPCGLAA